MTTIKQSKDDLDAVLHWRNKYTIAIKERDALQQRLNAADQRIDELEQDKARLDALDSNCWDVRFNSCPNGDAGDSSINIEVVGHWMDKPFERVIGENYSENLRAAIDQAMTAPAYPPARPEYPEPESGMDKPDHLKGMIEARGGKFAIMIDEANAHYGWTFRKDANGMWVSGRKATDVEMHAARTHAHITNKQ